MPSPINVVTKSSGSEFVPPLEPGDRLSRAEFERRYEAMSHIKKAELIEGVVYMPSPVRFSRHGQPHSSLITVLGIYSGSTPGVLMADNATVRLDLVNEPQPDALLLIDPACGGQTRISEDDYIERAPELVAEISSSSVSFDLNTKLAVYRRSGVREYLVWRVLDQQFDWFVLTNDEYQRLNLDYDGILKSPGFPGFWLDAAALLRGDQARVMETVWQGTASPGHAEFVHQLAAKRC